MASTAPVAAAAAATAVTSSTGTAVAAGPTATALQIPGSPILKAQLCAPPKANRKETAKQVKFTSIYIKYCRFLVIIRRFSRNATASTPPLGRSLNILSFLSFYCYFHLLFIYLFFLNIFEW